MYDTKDSGSVYGAGKRRPKRTPPAAPDSEKATMLRSQSGTTIEVKGIHVRNYVAPDSVYDQSQGYASFAPLKGMHKGMLSVT
jgi:hypothetical protein